MQGRHWIDTALTYGYVVRRKIRFSSVCGLSNFVPIARYQLAIPKLGLNLGIYNDGDTDLNNIDSEKYIAIYRQENFKFHLLILFSRANRIRMIIWNTIEGICPVASVIVYFSAFSIFR